MKSFIFDKNIKNMKVEEPTFAYGLPNNQLEDLRSRVIESVRKLTDVQLLMKFDRLLKQSLSHEKNHVKGQRVLSYDELPPEIQSLVGVSHIPVPENDINCKSVRIQALEEKYESLS
jgi:hypothetical protein